MQCNNILTNIIKCGQAIPKKGNTDPINTVSCTILLWQQHILHVLDYGDETIKC